eukprot:gene12221-biopygen2073
MGAEVREGEGAPRRWARSALTAPATKCDQRRRGRCAVGTTPRLRSFSATPCRAKASERRVGDRAWTRFVCRLGSEPRSCDPLVDTAED